MKRRKSDAGPAVNCTFGELRETATLKANPRNPNKHGAEQLRIYAKILNHQGWRKPIVVSRQSGFIVSGHGAWMAAAQEGWPQVPVDLQDFKTPADEFAHLLADNKLQQMAELAADEVAAILEQEIKDKLDLELAGVLEEEAEATKPAAQFPIVAQMLERHDYVVVFCDNEMDFQFLQQICGCRTEKSYKKQTIGIGRAVPFQRFMETIRANRDSLNEPVRQDNNAQAAETLPGVRAAEPGKRVRAGRRSADPSG